MGGLLVVGYGLWVLDQCYFWVDNKFCVSPYSAVNDMTYRDVLYVW